MKNNFKISAEFTIKLGPCRPRRLQGVTVNFLIPKEMDSLMQFCQNALQFSMCLRQKKLKKKHKTRWDVTTSILLGNSMEKKHKTRWENCPGRKNNRDANLKKKVIFRSMVDQNFRAAGISNLKLSFRFCGRYVEYLTLHPTVSRVFVSCFFVEGTLNI